MLSLLRYGRGVDNSRFKRAGFRYKYTTAGAVDAFARSLRLARALGSAGAEYTYERDVETFFRHSSAVVRDRG
jgi:UDP-glucose 4-epimerase